MTFSRKDADLRTPEQRKKDFLERFAQVGNVTAACKLAHQGRTQVYEWLKDDPEFLESFNAAEVEATENLEAEAWRRAVKGVKKVKPLLYLGEEVGEEVTTTYSDVLLMFLLKGRAPAKYAQRQDVHHSGGLAVGVDQLTTETERDAFRQFLLDRDEP